MLSPPCLKQMRPAGPLCAKLFIRLPMPAYPRHRIDHLISFFDREGDGERLCQQSQAAGTFRHSDLDTARLIREVAPTVCRRQRFAPPPRIAPSSPCFPVSAHPARGQEGHPTKQYPGPFRGSRLNKRVEPCLPRGPLASVPHTDTIDRWSAGRGNQTPVAAWRDRFRVIC